MSDQNWKPGETLNIAITEVNPYKETVYLKNFEGGGYRINPRETFQMTPRVAVHALGVRSKMEKDHQVNIKSLPKQIQSELSVNGVTITPTATPPDLNSIKREQAVLRGLIQLKTEILQKNQQTANSFYGSDPHNKTEKEYTDRFNSYTRQYESAAVTNKHWVRSYLAAYSVKYYNESIRLLTQHSNQLDAAYAEALAREEAARHAEAQARDAAEKDAKAQREDAERAERQKKIRNAVEMGDRFDVLLERFPLDQPENVDQKLRQRSEKYQELKTLHFELEKAERIYRSFHNPRSAQRRDSLRKIENDIKTLVREKHEIKNVALATVSGASASARSLVTTPDGLIAGYEGAPFSVTGATESLSKLRALASGGPVGVFFASAFYIPTLGNGELQRNPLVLSIPLSQFPNDEDDYENLPRNGRITVPVRAVASVRENHTQLYLSETGERLSPWVDVRKVELDPSTNLYTFTTEGLLPRTLTWTPNNAPGGDAIGSTELPPEQSSIKIYPGARITQVEGRTDEHPTCDEADSDDYILWFPAESGIEPVYIMLNRSGPRYEPGTATGIGQTVGANWLDSATEESGAPIPEQIADQLRGQEFRNFDKFRNAFWSAVATNAELSKQFSPLNLSIMKKGYSPYAPRREQVGSREKFEIHHIKPIRGGGEVYDIDNLAVTTPKAHISIHSKNNGEPQ